MLPIRHKSIFKNRWVALLWAGGVIWTAVDYAGHPKAASDGSNGADAADSSPISNDDLAAAQVVANEFDGIK